MLNFHLPFLATVGVAALVPMIIGFIWYNPKVLGTAWMKAAGLTQETAMKDFNMPLVMGLSLFFSFLLAFSMLTIVIHQYGLFSMLATPEGAAQFKAHSGPLYEQAKNLFTENQANFRTFKHGAFHGVIMGIFAILPVIATSAMFERKGWKYILINAGYWIICLAIMGGIICKFMPLTGIYPSGF